MTADGLIRISEVVELTSLSRSTIYRMMRRGDFPEPTRISERIIIWKRAQVMAWLKQPEKQQSAA